jgi:hypothetical protein
VCKIERYNRMKMARISSAERTARARERAKRTILELVRASDGKIVSKLRLHKAFYQAHLLYFEETGLELTGYPIVHMPNGPGIEDADPHIRELEAAGVLEESEGNGDFDNERVYTVVGEAAPELDAEKAAAIRAAVEWANALSITALKRESHKQSWHESGMGREQNIFVDAMTKERVSQIRGEAEERLFRVEDLATA